MPGQAQSEQPVLRVAGSPAPSKTLAEKIAVGMLSIGTVPKDGYNADQRYDYATASAIAYAVRRALYPQGVILYYSVTKRTTDNQGKTSGGKEVTRECVELEVTVTDGVESIKFNAVGEGRDFGPTGDKGIYKALTGAWKNALVNIGCLPTGDDPEDDGDKGEGGEHAEGAKEQSKAFSSKAAEKEQASANRGETPAQKAIREHREAAAKGEGQVPQQQAGGPAPKGKYEAHPPECRSCNSLTFGKNKGKPICQLDDDSLIFYRRLFLKSVNDPEKARFKSENQDWVLSVEDEMQRRGTEALLMDLSIPF